MTRIIAEAAVEAGLEEVNLPHLVGMAGLIEGLSDCLGFCMSSKGDRLSQWRGYADDGRGVSIGFSKAGLTAITKTDPMLKLQKVQYNIKEQKKRVHHILPDIIRLIADGAFRRASFGTFLAPKAAEEVENEDKFYRSKNSELFSHLVRLHDIWFSFKSPAFLEEEEFRLAMMILHGITYDFRTSGGRLVPYRSVDFPALPKGKLLIEEIVLGPKHPTPTNVVENFLRHNGFGDVKVKKSEASYR